MAKGTIAFRLEPEVMDRLERLAERQGVSKSQAARQVLEAGLNSVGDDDIKTTTGKREEVMATLAKSSEEMLADLDSIKTILADLKSEVTTPRPKTERAPEPPPVKKAKPPEPKPEPKAAEPAERRGPTRPRVDAWAVQTDRQRAKAHFVTEDTGNGFLGFACAARAIPAPEMSLSTEPRKRCPKCAEVIEPKLEKRGGPNDRRRADRPAGRPGRRDTDGLKRTIKIAGPEAVARIVNTTPEKAKAAADNPSVLTNDQWERLASSDSYKRANADLVRSSK